MQNYTIRTAGKEDLSLIYDIVDIIMENLHDPNFFAADEKETMAQMIEEKGFTLIVESGNTTVGFISVRFPMEDEDNLGYDIDLPREELCKVAHMETIAVLPEFRGKGLQKLMMTEAEKRLKTMDFAYYLATVYPKNSFSLNNFISKGYQIVKTKLKYGGLERHILMKKK